MHSHRFSGRLPAIQKKNHLAEALGQRDSNTPLLDLTDSNPTHVGLAPPISDLLGKIDPRNLDQYTPDPLGALFAREALAEALSEDRNLEISANDLVLLSSTSEAYGLLFRILGAPGDTVWTPSPSYPLFEQIVGLEGLQLKNYSLHFGGGDWYLDQNRFLEESFLKSQAAAVLAVHPNNPTGSYLSRSEAQLLERKCAQSQTPLIVDEVFYEYAIEYSPDAAPSWIRESPTPTLVLGGASKALCLPQLKISWIYISGPQAFREQIRKALEYASDAYLSLSGFSQALLPELLAQRHIIQEHVRERVKTNLRYLQDSVRNSPISLMPVQGGWYAILSLPPTRNDLQWSLSLLQNDDLRVHPGFLFDLREQACLVLSLIIDSDSFREGTERLLNRVRKEIS